MLLQAVPIVRWTLVELHDEDDRRGVGILSSSPTVHASGRTANGAQHSTVQHSVTVICW
jgi:hypothetical protein